MELKRTIHDELKFIRCLIRHKAKIKPAKNVERVFDSHVHTQGFIFEILLNQTEIILYLPFSSIDLEQ